MFHYDVSSQLTTNSSYAEILLESIGNFFRVLLIDEPSYNTYIKEWNAFKELIKKDPFNKSNIESYIYSLDKTKSKVLSPFLY